MNNTNTFLTLINLKKIKFKIFTELLIMLLICCRSTTDKKIRAEFLMMCLIYLVNTVHCELFTLHSRGIISQVFVTNINKRSILISSVPKWLNYF